MKLKIVGDGSFGSFLKELLAPHFTFCDDANSVILAVPFSAYEDVASKHKNKHLINVCSVQKPSLDICLKHSNRVTGLHPLFGRRTPADKRTSIITHFSADSMPQPEDPTTQRHWDDFGEAEFFGQFGKVSKITFRDGDMKIFTPESHDMLMAKTHLAAVICAKQAKVLVDRAQDIPDELIPNSFRLLRDFVKTLDDMPPGTMESILANPYF